MKSLLKSRKFWLTVTAVLGSIGAASTGEVSWSQALTASVGAIMANVLGIAVEDAAGKAK